MCNHKNFTSECGDCLDSLYESPSHAKLESAYEDGDYIHTNKHGAINELTVISGNVFHTSLMSRPMNCTLEEILAHGGSVVPLSYDCLACGEMVVTDDEDRHVVGLCDCCLDGDYSNPYDPPSQSDYDYTCTCEDAPCCGCNSEIGQISILYAVIVTILAVILHSVYNALLVPMLAVLGSI